MSSMTSVALVVGWAVLLVVALLFAALGLLFLKHVINSARFVWRIRQKTKHLEGTPSNWRLIVAWLRYAFGIDGAPHRVNLHAGGVICWPGYTYAETYPG
ncbi:hypothetical protein [Mesorhizobium sp. DCY119]|uniref:hypothetical protein n=1 Tax=Mesorhizobium sp. DCY119 TaxID=2108445 RepID=UPI000E6C4E4B|nr:hypothetical protein [Mesorhizobium sp. DCY119]RJG46484.1 hypothetical protein D3Y55_21055 [Mesorhizobium sp. DCY119]